MNSHRAGEAVIQQLYILCDLEGASQISPENKTAMHYGSALWQQEGRGFITSDLKAVCQAANEWGMDEIIINDDHDNGHREPNVLVQELPRNVRMVKRPHMPGTPRKMVRGELCGIIIVGQHAMYGGGGFAPHTIQSPPIEAVTINGIKVGEIGLELALFMDAKLLAVVGEEAAAKEARKLCPHVVTIPVKSLERNWFPQAKENYPVIKEKVLQALRQRQNAEGLHLEPPYQFSLKMTENFTFDPEKRFFLRWLAKQYFFGRYKGRMEDREAFWQAKTIIGGLSALQATRLFMRKRVQA